MIAEAAALPQTAASAPSHQSEIDAALERLLATISEHDAHADLARVRDAFHYADAMHVGQKRYSNAPYITHPLAVAQWLAEQGLDTDTVITALLHDVVEDTEATFEDLERRFGGEVARLVDGVTKLASVRFTSKREEQAENFRKLMVSMSDDVRTLVVKLADRLHNMETLGFHPKPEKRQRIAQETVDMFAPLAGRMGMQALRERLEHLSFRELNPEGLEAIEAHIARLTEQTGTSIGDIQRNLEYALAEAGLPAIVKGRRKTPFSIWRKMQRKDIGFEQLSDVYGFRILVEDETSCYAALGIVHRKWRFVPGRFKDYISTPKPNGYRSVHTTILGPGNNRVEVQVRTHAMDVIAERGVAAHWRYRDRAGSHDADVFAGLRAFKDMLEHASDPQEFFEHSRLELFQDQVFCFTPKGDLITLPRGATPLDFAYAVHTRVGDTCVGVKINGSRADLRDELRNGDSVEILTAKAQRPQPEWEAIAQTGRARQAIRRYLRAEANKEFAGSGRALLEAAFEEAEVTFSDKACAAAAERLNLEGEQDLMVAVGRGDVSPAEVVRAAFPAADRRLFKRVANRFRERGGRQSVPVKLPVKGLAGGTAVRLAECCSPLPGDRIVGLLRKGQGVEVHVIDCDRLAEVETGDEVQWIDLAWTDEAGETFNPVGRVRLKLAHGPGALAEVTSAIARGGGNITNLKMAERRVDYFLVVADIEIEDARHLGELIASLRILPKVLKAERVRARS